MSLENPLLCDLESMLKSDSPQELYRSDAYSNKLLHGLKENYEDGKFCDVTFIVGEKLIKAHRVVLSSFSLYFKALFDSFWKENEQEKIHIQDIDERTLKCLINFAYSGELEVNTANVLDLLSAADFLQIDFVKTSCGKYLKSLVNHENCLTMLIIANKFNVLELESYLVNFAARYFFTVSQFRHFLDLPVKVLARLLQNESLVVDKGQDFLPSVAAQESIVLERVLLYVSHQTEESKPEIMKELLQNVRLLLLPLSTLDNLQTNKDVSNCPAAKYLVKQVVDSLNSNHPDGVTLPELYAKPRKATEVHESRRRVHAFGYIRPEQSSFNDRDLAAGSDTFLQGMKIWIRHWDGRPVIGGLQTFYSNGETSLYGGQDTTSEVEEFHLKDGERIVKVDINSGWMIDHLKFHTNKSRVLGPYGGPGGSSYSEEPRGAFGFLGYIKGAVALTQEKLGIIKFCLVWKEFLVDFSESKGKNFELAEQSGNEEFSNHSESPYNSDFEYEVDWQ